MNIEEKYQLLKIKNDKLVQEIKDTIKTINEKSLLEVFDEKTGKYLPAFLLQEAKDIQ